MIKKLQMIEEIKKTFEKELEKELSLIKVECPLFVIKETGLQDDLSGKEKGVSFEKDKETYEIVHSLAKWKRDALYRYQFPIGKGILTDMKAIRKDEEVDDIHSMYVEQWDWEKRIDRKDRTISYLKKTVRGIYRVLKKTDRIISQKYGNKPLDLPKSIYFLTTQELEDLYPDKTPKEREELITKEKRAVFLIGIGDLLKSGIPHDLRSPDYDDWSLDGDILIYDDVLKHEIEITSMGIRVDQKALLEQLEKSGCMDRLTYSYHQKIVQEEYPYTIGGGIGLSRVILLILQCHHIAEAQASSWDEKTLKSLKTKEIL